MTQKETTKQDVLKQLLRNESDIAMLQKADKSNVLVPSEIQRHVRHSRNSNIIVSRKPQSAKRYQAMLDRKAKKADGIKSVAKDVMDLVTSSRNAAVARSTRRICRLHQALSIDQAVMSVASELGAITGGTYRAKLEQIKTIDKIAAVESETVELVLDYTKVPSAKWIAGVVKQIAESRLSAEYVGVSEVRPIHGLTGRVTDTGSTPRLSAIHALAFQERVHVCAQCATMKTYSANVLTPARYLVHANKAIQPITYRKDTNTSATVLDSPLVTVSVPSVAAIRTSEVRHDCTIAGDYHLVPRWIYSLPALPGRTLADYSERWIVNPEWLALRAKVRFPSPAPGEVKAKRTKRIKPLVDVGALVAEYLNAFESTVETIYSKLMESVSVELATLEPSDRLNVAVSFRYRAIADAHRIARKPGVLTADDTLAKLHRAVSKFERGILADRKVTVTQDVYHSLQSANTADTANPTYLAQVVVDSAIVPCGCTTPMHESPSCTRITLPNGAFRYQTVPTSPERIDAITPHESVSAITPLYVPVQANVVSSHVPGLNGLTPLQYRGPVTESRALPQRSIVEVPSVKVLNAPSDFQRVRRIVEVYKQKYATPRYVADFAATSMMPNVDGSLAYRLNAPIASTVRTFDDEGNLESAVTVKADIAPFSLYASIVERYSKRTPKLVPSVTALPIVPSVAVSVERYHITGYRAIPRYRAMTQDGGLYTAIDLVPCHESRVYQAVSADSAAMNVRRTTWRNGGIGLPSVRHESRAYKTPLPFRSESATFADYCTWLQLRSIPRVASPGYADVSEVYQVETSAPQSFKRNGALIGLQADAIRNIRGNVNKAD